MAVRFDTSTDRLIRTANVINYNTAYTLCGWVYFVSLRAAFGDVFSINDGSATNYDVFGLNDTDHFYVESTSGSSVDDTSSPVSASTWYFFVLRRASATSLTARLYNAAGTIVFTATTTQNVSGRAASSRMEFNGTSTEGEWCNMRVAYAKAWSTNLSDAELLNEQNCIMPMRTDSLVGWWPLLPTATERDVDYSGLGRTFTEAGTLTDEDPPSVSWYAPRPYVIYIAGGGTTFTVSVDGTLTSAGGLIKQDNKITAGSMASSGGITKQDSKLIIGTLTSSGLLLKQAEKILIGGLTSAGALIKQMGKVLGGALSSGGNFIKQDNKNISGVMASVGGLMKQVNKALAGTLTSSGTLANIKASVLNLAGTFASTGTLSKQDQKATAGTLSSSGGLSKLVNKLMVGILTSAGALSASKVSNTFFLTVGGTLASGGVLIKQTQKTMDGVMTSAGGIMKRINHALSGILTSIGTFIGAKTGGQILVGFDLATTQTLSVLSRKAYTPFYAAAFWDADMTLELTLPIHQAESIALTIYTIPETVLYYDHQTLPILSSAAVQLTIYGESIP